MSFQLHVLLYLAPQFHMCSFNPPTFSTHTQFWAKTGMFGLKTPCLCLFMLILRTEN